MSVNSISVQQPQSHSDLLSHLQPTDYPDSQSELVQTLSDFRSVTALPGEPLGKTDVVQHHIQLVNGSQPVYIPAYRMPHSKPDQSNPLSLRCCKTE